MHVDMEDTRARLPRYFTLEMLMSVMVALSGLVLIWNLVSPVVSVLALFIAGIEFTLSITVLIRLLMDPDSVRARQSSNVLQLASQTLEAMGEEGLDSKSAQRICSLLLPSTAAIAVAITDDRFILGYAGYEESHNLSGSVIRTHATYSTLADGKTRVLFTPEEIGFPKGTPGINAAIIVPMPVGKDVKGTLKFYYRRAGHISETQKSIATGFGQLLSTQMAASALEEQTALATKMELMMLQSQINPHFLFNMLNNANVLIKRNPEEASKVLFKLEDLLRYQINDSSRERVSLASDIRFLNDYLNLEKIRRDHFQFTVEQEGDIDSIWIQPLLFIPFVENAVKHSFDSEHPSSVHLSFKVEENRLEFRCENSTPAVAVSNKVGGIGLANIQRRLGLLYPDRNELEQIENENRYIVILCITL